MSTFNLSMITPMPNGQNVLAGETGTKYLIVTEGGFGMTYTIAVWLEVVKGSYAQYSHVLKVRYREPRKRTAFERAITPDKYLAVYKLENAPSKLDPMVSNGDGSQTTKYSMYDSRWLADWKEHARHAKAELIYSNEPIIAPFGCYRVVFKDADTGRLDKQEYRTPEEMTQAGFTITGTHESHSTRAELKGHPKFANLLGPMWDGTDADGKGIIRYETSEANAVLSS